MDQWFQCVHGGGWGPGPAVFRVVCLPPASGSDTVLGLPRFLGLSEPQGPLQGAACPAAGLLFLPQAGWVGGAGSAALVAVTCDISFPVAGFIIRICTVCCVVLRHPLA